MVLVLKTKDILDEKEKILRTVSKEVTFPLTKKDKETIETMIKYLHDSQIDELSEKYDLRPGMGMSAIQLGIPKRYFVVVHEIEEGEFDTYILINPRITPFQSGWLYVCSNTKPLQAGHRSCFPSGSAAVACSSDWASWANT